MAIYEYTRAFIADPDDPNYPDAPTTVLVDLSTLEADCDARGFGFHGSRGGGPAFSLNHMREVALGAIGVDGEEQAAHGYGRMEITFQLIWKAGPLVVYRIPAALEDLDALSAAMDDHGVLVIQYQGSETLLYYDFQPSQIGQMLRGQALSLWKLDEVGADPDGMPITFRCNPPWPRLAPETATATVSNDLLDRDLLVSHSGNRQSEIKAVFTPSAGSLVGYLIGIREDNGALPEFRTSYDAALSAGTYTPAGKYPDAASVADANAVGGNAVEVDFATVESYARRVRDHRQLVDPRALEGAFIPFLRMRAVSIAEANRSRFKVGLHLGVNTDDIVLQALPPILLDWRDITGPEFVSIPLCDPRRPISIPQSSDVIMEIWASRLNGSQAIRLSNIILVPADYHSILVGVPGWRQGEPARVVYQADELDGTGELKKDAYRLNALNEIGRVEPDAGNQLTAGLYQLEVDVSVKEPDDATITSGANPTEKEIGRLMVVEDPTGAATTQAQLILRNKKNRSWTRLKRILEWSVSAAEEAANAKFREQVKQTVATLSGRRIEINKLVRRYIPTITSTRPAVIQSYPDLTQRRTYAGTNDLESFPLIPENELPLVPAADSVWVVMAFDAPDDSAYRDVDERGAIGRDVLTRETVVDTTTRPRRTHGTG